MRMIRMAAGIPAFALMGSAARALEQAKAIETSLGTVFADQNGIALYPFDKGHMVAGVSACIDRCIRSWPPFLAAPEGAMAGGDRTIVDVKDADGAMKKMWAYDGRRLSLFVKGTKPGDVTGELIGVWHVAKPAT